MAHQASLAPVVPVTKLGLLGTQCWVKFMGHLLCSWSNIPVHHPSTLWDVRGPESLSQDVRMSLLAQTEVGGGPAAGGGPGKVPLLCSSHRLLPRCFQPAVSQSPQGAECSSAELSAQSVEITFRVAARHPFPLILARAFQF